DETEFVRGMAVEIRGNARQCGASVFQLQPGRRRAPISERALAGNSNGPFVERGVDELRTVVLQTGNGHKQRSTDREPRVRDHRRDLHIEIALRGARGDTADQIADLHGATSAKRKVRTWFSGNTSPGKGSCDWTTPLPSARTRNPAAVALATAARASRPLTSGTPARRPTLAARSSVPDSCEIAASEAVMSIVREGIEGGTPR